MTAITNHLIVLLVIFPAVAGLICVPLVNRLGLCRVVGTLGFALNLGLAITLLGTCRDAGDGINGGIIVSQMGGWAAPYGITLVFDALSGLLLSAASLVALACLVHAAGSLPNAAERRYFHPLVNFMMAGVNLSFLTGDLFNLFVAFEIMLMASYGLLVLGRGRAQLAQAYKYVLLNLVASSVFVIAAGMAYGMLGTLNLADMARVTGELAANDALPPGFAALGILFLFVFALKAGVFPLWFWLPDTYPTCPIAIAALFGGVLTKVGAYAIARVFPLVFFVGDGADILIPIITLVAALTMGVGVLGALAYRGLRRILAMFIIVGVGYALFGIATHTAGSLGGSAFYMAQSMIVMAAVFLACGMIESHAGTDELTSASGATRIGGLLKTHPWLGVLFLIGLLSVAGLPPTAGFYGKFAIIREGLGNGFTKTALIAIIVGGFSLLAVIRVWGTSFWGPPPEHPPTPTHTAHAPSGSSYAALSLLIVAALLIGFLPQPVASLANTAGQQTARQNDRPSPYVTAVLGRVTAQAPSTTTHHNTPHPEGSEPHTQSNTHAPHDTHRVPAHHDTPAHETPLHQPPADKPTLEEPEPHDDTFHVNRPHNRVAAHTSRRGTQQ